MQMQMNVELAKMESAQRAADRSTQQQLMDRMYYLAQRQMSINEYTAQEQAKYNQDLLDSIKDFNYFRMAMMARELSLKNNALETLEQMAAQSGDPKTAQAAADATAKVTDEMNQKRKLKETTNNIKAAVVASWDPADPLGSYTRFQETKMTIPGVEGEHTAQEFVDMALNNQMAPEVAATVLDIYDGVFEKLQTAPELPAGVTQRQQKAMEFRNYYLGKLNPDDPNVQMMGGVENYIKAMATNKGYIGDPQARRLWNDYTKTAAAEGGTAPNLADDIAAATKGRSLQEAMTNVRQYTDLRGQTMRSAQAAKSALAGAKAGIQLPASASTTAAPSAATTNVSPYEASPGASVATPTSATAKEPPRSRPFINPSPPKLPQTTPPGSGILPPGVTLEMPGALETYKSILRNQSWMVDSPNQHEKSPAQPGGGSAGQEATEAPAATTSKKMNPALLNYYAMSEGIDEMSIYDRVSSNSIDPRTGMYDVGRANSEVYGMMVEAYKHLAQVPGLTVGPLGEFFAGDVLAGDQMQVQ
jgi:hypothetical protein